MSYPSKMFFFFYFLFFEVSTNTISEMCMEILTNETEPVQDLPAEAVQNQVSLAEGIELPGAAMEPETVSSS